MFVFETRGSISAIRGAFCVFRRCRGKSHKRTGGLFTEYHEEREDIMKVIVQDNQIEKAIRDLKKKLTKEGFFSEIKERRFYDKPSVQKKKKQAKAAKRRRKRMRKFY